MEEGFDRAQTNVYEANVLEATETYVKISTDFSLGGYSRLPILYGNAIWTVDGTGEISLEDLTAAGHPYELKRRKEIIVNVDYKMSGVGSNSCGPELLKKYRLDEKEFEFVINIMPVFKEN